MIWATLLQMGGGMGTWGMGGFVGPVLWLLVLVTIGILLWSALGGRGSSNTESERSTDAIEELRERYARGEIDEETFENRLRRLQNR